MWSNFRPKSQEELDKEKEERSRREKELQEAMDKRREAIDHCLKEIDAVEEVKFALEHLTEPSEIAKHINSTSRTYFLTSFKINMLSEWLKRRAELVNEKAELDGRSSPVIPLVPRFQKLSPSPISRTPRSDEGNELRQLAHKLSGEADYYYNNRKELGDDDPNATPLTLFTVRRVTNFLPQLFDNKARLAYLLKLKNSFLRQDEKGQIRNNGMQTFRADKDFQLQLEHLINTYREITEVEGEVTPRTSPVTDTSKKNPEFSTTRQVLAITYLLEHLGAKPATKKVTADFIEFLTSKNHKEIYNKIGDSTLLTERGGNTALFLRDWFQKLGLDEIVKDIDSNATITKKK